MIGKNTVKKGENKGEFKQADTSIIYNLANLPGFRFFAEKFTIYSRKEYLVAVGFYPDRLLL